MSKKALVRVFGVVQGVGFRPFIYRMATRLGLNGYVKNLGDAGVEIQAGGSRADILQFITLIKREKPGNARVDRISVEWIDSGDEFGGFQIMRSGGTGSGGTIAPDLAVCDECIREILAGGGRRFHYPLTTCTDCGPRFSVAGKIPLDRENTSFKKFILCKGCAREYKNPVDRRFHAQTIACPECGPVYSLLDGKGVILQNPLDTAIEKLRGGEILAIKGFGGIHLACVTSRDKIVKGLRERLDRKQQPFAVMSTLEMIRSFAEVSLREERLLTSRERPIVVLKKSREYWLSNLISPGLDSVGVLLPYTGLHHLLFKEIDEPLVMTSANIHGEPMITKNREILEQGMADYYLLHDLGIENRCDDSVIKIVNGRDTFIRRSRGFVPVHIKIEDHSDKNILAVGSKENVTFCLLKDNSAFLSQHIGNTGSVKTLGFMEESIKNLMRLIPVEIDLIACDLHPGFNTTKLAADLSGKFNAPLVKVQHHHAHLSSIIAEHGLDEVVGICCDGLGYGSDGRLWGGEIISYKKKEFRRRGHLREQPMPGGDLSTQYPARMVAGILHGRYGENELKKILGGLYFRHGAKEIPVVLKQLSDDINVQRTTSTGRVLDAIASLLGVCPYRSYEGEPAVKLESAAEKGGWIEFPVPVKDNILDTTGILETVVELKRKHRVCDIAFSAQKAIAEGLARIAVDVAFRERISCVGISGGVAYNNLIVKTIADYVEGEDLGFLQNERVPCGDGGISFGQAGYVICSNRVV